VVYKSILIVEDEVLIRNYLKDVLVSQGCDIVATIDTGEEAVKITGEKQIDLILMDIKLAGQMSGLEAARIILSRSSVKIVFISAYDFANEIKKLNAFVEFLHKPINIDELKHILENK
jgi:two-component system, cell cycle sensor histidine kinase and response regulator CckA